jgi:hypothetical protein
MSARTSEIEGPLALPSQAAAAAAGGVIDAPLDQGASVRWLIRLLARLHANHLDAVAMVVALTPTAVVHAWGMERFPSFFDDEGAYVSQAYAVDKLHALAPYTYWYDHPPLGWILLGGWAKLVPMFSSTSSSIASARVFVFLLFIVSAAFLYGVARRLSLSPAMSALAVALFALSPLALNYQRMVLLDNLATPWLLAAFFLALSPRRRLIAYGGAAVCMAAAVLTKETFLLFLPALTGAIWTTCPKSTRRFAIAVFLAVTACIGSFYPLFALFRGELLPGRGHTSLFSGIQFQLSRVGGGSIFNAHSPTRHLVDSWLKLDPVLLVCAVASIVPLLALRRLRWVGLALAVPIALALRPGSYIPAMYIVALLPFAALGLAALAAEAAARSRDDRRQPLLRTAFAAAAIVVLAVPSGIAAARWVPRDASMMHTNDARGDRRAVEWLVLHAPRSSRILVDASIWTDLVDRGFGRHRVVWFYKLDLDPAVSMPWWRFDYVVRSNVFAGNLGWLPRSRAVYDHSRIVAVFTTKDERIEIRRVLKPSGPNQAWAPR